MTSDFDDRDSNHLSQKNRTSKMVTILIENNQEMAITKSLNLC
jgi:hypothetical protein